MNTHQSYTVLVIDYLQDSQFSFKGLNLYLRFSKVVSLPHPLSGIFIEGNETDDFINHAVRTATQLASRLKPERLASSKYRVVSIFALF
jgi:hypothetical protein